MNEYYYINNWTNYQRRKTNSVKIGSKSLGSNFPIRIQTMINTSTLDTAATVDQCEKCIKAGAEYIRITTQTAKEAYHIKEIKKELQKRNLSVPIIADVHYRPEVAEIAANGIVEKVRINPGNYVDKQKNKVFFSKDEYESEHKKIHSRLIPLINICKKNNTVIRIGTNHGSLSARIMSRYGDTPLGMAEATMEFLRIFKQEDFDNVVISLKASNVQIMVQATRILVKMMENEDIRFPFHLGVTEAGNGEEGRIKSAIGIGTLLADGIGDTIRVSLTESPENELPVAQKIIDYITTNLTKLKSIKNLFLNPYEFNKRETKEIKNIGFNHAPIVISDFCNIDKFSQNMRPDYVYCKDLTEIQQIETKNIKISCPYKIWKKTNKNSDCLPILSIEEYQNLSEKLATPYFLTICFDNLSSEILTQIKNDKNIILICTSKNTNNYLEFRAFFLYLLNKSCQAPVVIHSQYSDNLLEDFQIKASIDIGGLFLDGLGNGIWLQNKQLTVAEILRTSFCILQASRVRITQTEYISCPTCGRTRFNIQDILEEIKSKTAHLKGLKIAVMGCVVNGPGEMADADYGYVGAGKNTVNLYKNKQVIKKNINEKQAVNELIKIIKANNDWIE